MKIVIIGAGFTGLSLAYRLSQKGHDVTIIEAENKAGGLAIGFKNGKWKWSLEKHYHHWFVNDYSILTLAKEIGQKVIKYRPKTSTYYQEKIYQIDSPLALMSFSKLSFMSRIRTGFTLFLLKVSPFLKYFQEITSEKFIIYSMGKDSWNVLWKPLFKKKFHEDYKKISLVWFWARIKKRTPSLLYPEGGFQNFADRIVKKLHSKDVKIYFNERYLSFKRSKDQFLIKTNKRTLIVDKIINTQPLRNTGIKMIGATNLVLELKKPFFSDGTYWLNVNDQNFPFLAIVEHTNFMNCKHYNNKNIVYIGNYLDTQDKLYNMNLDELIKTYTPYLNKINPSFNKKMISNKYLFKAPFAQQIVTKGYHKKIPAFVSKENGIYIANIQQVYPWDRGTNYAVEIGNTVSELI